MAECFKPAHAIRIGELRLENDFTYHVRSQVTLPGYTEFLSIRATDMGNGLHVNQTPTLKKSRSTCSYTGRLKSGSELRSISLGSTHL